MLWMSALRFDESLLLGKMTPCMLLATLSVYIRQIGLANQQGQRIDLLNEW